MSSPGATIPTPGSLPKRVRAAVHKAHCAGATQGPRATSSTRSGSVDRYRRARRSWETPRRSQPRPAQVTAGRGHGDVKKREPAGASSLGRRKADLTRRGLRRVADAVRSTISDELTSGLARHTAHRAARHLARRIQRSEGPVKHGSSGAPFGRTGARVYRESRRVSVRCGAGKGRCRALEEGRARLASTSLRLDAHVIARRGRKRDGADCVKRKDGDQRFASQNGRWKGGRL